MIHTLLFVSVIYSAHPPPKTTLSDSTQNVSTKKLTLRLHTAGVFAYSGRIVTTNPVADINFNYERKSWGYTFFKAVDLFDGRTPINFMITGFYSNIRVSKRLTITPYLALRLEQNRSLADRGSDAVFIVTTSLRLHSNWILDNTSLLSNIIIDTKSIDWTNRFRLLYSCNHINGGLFVWNNNRVLDNTDFISGGINMAYSRIKISNRLTMSAGITGIIMLKTSDESEFPKRNGIVFSIASTWH